MSDGPVHPGSPDLDEMRRLSVKGKALPPEAARALLDEIESLRSKLSVAKKFEESYIAEIRRMNRLVTELADYVQTIADVVSDRPGSEEISAELNRRVVELILRSSEALKREVDEA